VTYALLMTAYTAINIPYSALNGIIFNYAGTSVIAGIVMLVCFYFYRLAREWSEQTA